jgi:intron-binding protein aquarius
LVILIFFFSFPQVLIGYPPEKISILTTYNGQKDLIGDIVERRCGPGTPLAGIRPFAISTVDQYQGQQNDYILLSLVRTSAIGHIRDVRRLTVAVSRARLGLYVVGRKDLFDACHELQPAMQIFGTKPCKLQLVSDEKYDACTRNLQDKIDDERLFVIEDLTSLGLLVHSMQEELAKRLRM